MTRIERKPIRSARLAVLLALPVLLGPSPVAAQTHGHHEYAAKFVCGPTGHTTIVADGVYYTAVNVHNPGVPLDLRWKVAIAGANQAGPVSKFEAVALKNDEALDIDCRSIRNRLTASGIPAPSFTYTGFVVIQAMLPLDVVAVYTASSRPTATLPGNVVSIHTERVPPRITD